MPADVQARLLRGWTRRGAQAWLLAPLAALFGALVLARRAAYRAGWLRSRRLPVPVVVVGNLVAGGAGKTPTVLALVRVLRAAGWRPGVISRGHGRHTGDVRDVAPGSPAAESGDEPLLLRRRSGVPVVVGRDRWAAGMALLRAHPEVDVVVADDGLQHLALARDVQVIVFDERGAGNGWLLPAGPLREPLPRQRPPRTLVLYTAGTASTPLPGALGRRTLAGACPLAQWHAGARPAPGSLASLAGRRLLAVAGIAKPEGFFTLLRSAGMTIDTLPLPDHHDYARLPWPAGTPEVIVTEKDAVKLDPARLGATQVWVAPLDFETPAGFDAALLDLLPPPVRHREGPE